MRSFQSDKTGRGKNLKNDDVPEVSEDEDDMQSLNQAKLVEGDNQQAAGGGPTYRDMEDEDEDLDDGPINRYSPTTPKQMQH